MRKTKVAFFSDILIEGFDGAQRTMFHIIERIPMDQYEYCFICGEGPGNNFDFKVLDVPNVTIPFNKSYSMAMPALAYFRMKKSLDNFRPDVIHIASPSFLGKFAVEYALKRSIPVITIYHTHFISYVDYYLRRIPVIAPVAKSSVISSQRNFYNSCNLVLVPTGDIRNELIELGFEGNKMKIWRRGIDHKVFNPEKKDSGLIRSIAGNMEANILFASRLVWEKNLKTLINIYRLFKEKKEKVNFIIAGDGIARETLEEKMPDAVFTGNVSQERLSMLYASADIFLFPSISETYGNVVAEAMSCGCPCVIGKGGGTLSLVEDGVNGMLCEPEDEYEYFEKIQMIRQDDNLRNSLIMQGLSFTKTLNWNHLVEEYLSYVDVLARETAFA